MGLGTSGYASAVPRRVLCAWRAGLLDLAEPGPNLMDSMTDELTPAELADSLADAAELLQHDDKRLTGKHYRTKVQTLKTVR